jgi:hypothetical protein
VLACVPISKFFEPGTNKWGFLGFLLFTNSFHYSGSINECLVNGSSPKLIKSHLSWNLNCLCALASIFQKCFNARDFTPSWNFKCFYRCLWNKSHFSTLLSSLIFGNCKGIFCLEMSSASILNLRFCVNGIGIPYLNLNDYHCVTCHFVAVLGALPRSRAPPTWSCSSLVVSYPSFSSCGLVL